ncbi:MAG: hypothetical protein IPM30_04360 [Burkholderiales bacterium]|nr:hypothetical protein [Burkholderiales bacterium]
MTIEGFSVSYLRDAQLDSGLRSLFEHRELGHREDLELQQIVMPAPFAADDVPAV